MKEIQVNSPTIEESIHQLQKDIGGTIVERWGEFTLLVDNDIASGSIQFITYGSGITLLNYNITFLEEVVLVTDASIFNPIQFVYCLQGFFEHRYEKDLERKKIEQYQSVIITGRDGGYDYGYYPKNIKLNINIIQVIRHKFLRRRLSILNTLNKRLYDVFLDQDHKRAYEYYGTFNLQISDEISELRKIKAKGMVRILRIEGMAYQILSMHIQEHDRALNKKRLPTSLTKKELKTTHLLAKNIVKDVSNEYSLEILSKESGLSQAKLQEGFKLLYSRTVKDYIRHIRIELARDLMNTSDLNISEIVYSIGFSSRSYFAKIFRDKYNITPSEYIKYLKRPIDAA